MLVLDWELSAPFLLLPASSHQNFQPKLQIILDNTIKACYNIFILKIKKKENYHGTSKYTIPSDYATR